MTAHLAAGHSNVDERNADYRTIVNGLHFLKGKTIDSHEYGVVLSVFPPANVLIKCRNVVWLADTNYRIELDNELVRQLATSDDFDALLAADQVRFILDTRYMFSLVLQNLCSSRDLWTRELRFWDMTRVLYCSVRLTSTT